MNAELIARNLVLLIPIALAIWIFFEKGVPLPKRLIFMLLLIITVFSFIMFYSSIRLKHDYEMKELEYGRQYKHDLNNSRQ